MKRYFIAICVISYTVGSVNCLGFGGNSTSHNDLRKPIVSHVNSTTKSDDQLYNDYFFALLNNTDIITDTSETNLTQGRSDTPEIDPTDIIDLTTDAKDQEQHGGRSELPSIDPSLIVDLTKDDIMGRSDPTRIIDLTEDKQRSEAPVIQIPVSPPPPPPPATIQLLSPPSGAPAPAQVNIPSVNPTSPPNQISPIAPHDPVGIMAVPSVPETATGDGTKKQPKVNLPIPNLIPVVDPTTNPSTLQPAPPDLGGGFSPASAPGPQSSPDPVEPSTSKSQTDDNDSQEGEAMKKTNLAIGTSVALSMAVVILAVAFFVARARKRSRRRDKISFVSSDFEQGGDDRRSSSILSNNVTEGVNGGFINGGKCKSANLAAIETPSNSVVAAEDSSTEKGKENEEVTEDSWDRYLREIDSNFTVGGGRCKNIALMFEEVESPLDDRTRIMLGIPEYAQEQADLLEPYWVLRKTVSYESSVGSLSTEDGRVTAMSSQTLPLPSPPRLRKSLRRPSKHVTFKDAASPTETEASGEYFGFSNMI